MNFSKTLEEQVGYFACDKTHHPCFFFKLALLGLVLIAYDTGLVQTGLNQ